MWGIQLEDDVSRSLRNLSTVSNVCGLWGDRDGRPGARVFGWAGTVLGAGVPGPGKQASNQPTNVNNRHRIMKTLKAILLGLTVAVAAVMASSCSSNDEPPSYVAPPPSPSK